MQYSAMVVKWKESQMKLACSLAGHWGLGKLIAFYDDNHISIDGNTEIAFTETVEMRFEGLGWHVIWVKNGNTGYNDIRAAIKEAKAVKDKPTLIKVICHMIMAPLKFLSLSVLDFVMFLFYRLYRLQPPLAMGHQTRQTRTVHTEVPWVLKRLMPRERTLGGLMSHSMCQRMLRSNRN